MKRGLLIVVIMGIMLLFAGVAMAVKGPCSDCHTMHYSQTPWPSDWQSTGGPFDFLLGGTCIGCHSGSSANPVKTLSGGSKVPVVLFTDTCPSDQGPGVTLAGGNFCWVDDDVGSREDEKGHNVAGIVGVDSNLGYDPPGWDPSYTSGFTFGQVTGGDNASWSEQLTCAGTFGCHGFHTPKGVGGSHHNNKGADPSTNSYGKVPATGTDNCGGYYRFLANIQGGEDGDWEYTANESDHNEYKGANITSGRNVEDPTGPPGDQTTISYLCAECHGVFHSRITDQDPYSTPYLRHPTDTVLPASGEYQYYNPDNSNVYSIEAPVARVTIPDSPSNIVTPGTDIVMCLSCHRAHGSPYNDILRWDYSQIIAGQGTEDKGCFVCHTQKNAD